MSAPKSWGWGLALSVVAIALSLIPGTTQQTIAAPVINDVIALQAERIENSLEELKEFSKKDLDPRVGKVA